ncbi:MAG: tetratricopeptide repeat protein [Thermodesulfobacteriota bacterium]
MNDGLTTYKRILNSTRALVLVIAAFAFLLYFNALFGGFIDDDHTLILGNEWLRDFANLPSIFFSGVWSFEEGHGATNYYRPVYSLLYMVDYALFGYKAWGWHLINIILHMLNSVMVFYVARELLGKNSDGDVANGNLLAFIAALIFVAHPIHTEVVAWISPIGELSFTLAFLVSFYFYILARDADKSENFKRNYAISIAAFFIGTLSKETALTLLILLPVYDLIMREQKKPWLIKAVKLYLPFYAVTIIYFFLRTSALGGLTPKEGMHPYLSGFQYFINIFPLLFDYFKALVWPAGLSSFHPFNPVYSVGDGRFIVSAIVLGIILIGGVLLRKRSRLYPLSLAIVIIPLLVVLYVPVLDRNTFAERYLYLSVLGFALFLVLGARHLLLKRPELGKLVTVFFAVLLIVYSAATVRRTFEWRDDFTLWKATIEKQPENYFILSRLARMYFERGDVGTATKLLERSIAANLKRTTPDPRVLGFSLMGLGDFYRIQKEPAKALATYMRFMEIAPGRGDINLKIADLYLNSGETKKAIAFYSDALRYAASAEEAVLSFRGLGRAYGAAGEREKAVRSFREALKISPGDEPSINALKQLENKN